MELLNELISLGPDGMSMYRRQMGVYFSLLQDVPWNDGDPDVVVQQIIESVPVDRSFDILLDHRFSVFKTLGPEQGSHLLSVLQSDDALTVSGYDTPSLALFKLSIGTDTIHEAMQRFLPVKHRVKRLVLRMPSKDFSTFVYLDWQALSADPMHVDLALRTESCIFVPRLAHSVGSEAQTHLTDDQIPVDPHHFSVVRPPAGLAPVPAAPKTFDVVVPHGDATVPVVDMPMAAAPDASAILSKPVLDRRKLIIILPLSDDLRTSFLAFGYTIGAGVGHARVLEIGAFRRNLRSSYSRLMGGTEVIDLKAQPPSLDVVSELGRTLRHALDVHGDICCFIGSEVLSGEVLNIFRSFAADFDLVIHAIVCSAAAPSAEMMEMIRAGLDGHDLHVQLVCFVPAGELSGFADAAGRPRGYFGVPPVEGQSMARCMEFRSNVVDPAFIVPASVPPRETHALERFIGAFGPLREAVT